jgi:DNA polymerase-3 subunit beta
MNLVVEKSDFQRIISAVSSAVSSKSTMPILSNILMEAKKGQLRCAATDLEVGLDCRVPVTIEEEGGIALPAKKINEIVRELPNAAVKMEVEGGVAKFTCDRTHFSLSGMSTEDFPPMPNYPDKDAFKIEQSVLKNLIEKTRIAVSTEELRYALNGIYFHSLDNELRLVSTDGRRLAMMKIIIESGINEKLGIIIPTKAINQLSSVLEGEEEINIAVKNNQIFFKTEKFILSSRLIDGQFPNYEQVIPPQRDKKIVLDTVRFLQALKRVSILASEKNNMVKLLIEEGRVNITASTPELGEATDEMDVIYSGEPMQVAYNVRYVMDVLKNIDSDETLLEFNQPLSPGVFRPADSQNYINVIMPMKINQ